MRTERIAFVGPGLAGKSSSLQSAIRIAGGSPTLICAGEEYGFTWTAHNAVSCEALAFVSGRREHVWYPAGSPPLADPGIVRELDLLRRSNGVIFVWDSQRARTPQNQESLENLHADLGNLSPNVICLANKRDLQDLLSLEEIQQLTGLHCVAGIASRDVGTRECLDQLLALAREGA